MHNRIIFAQKVWHRFFARSHEVAVAIMLEIGKAPLIFMLLVGAAVLVLIAAQVAWAAEEV